MAGRRDIALTATSRGPNRLPFPLPAHVHYDEMDITDSNRVQAVWAQHQPDIAVHTAALTMVNVCEANPGDCRRINVEGTRHMVQACRQYQTHLVHLSTDFIFDGLNGPYREEDVPHPVNEYGRCKLEAELLVRESRGPWTVVRTCLAFGLTAPGTRFNILTWAKENLAQGRKIKAVSDQLRTPTLIDDLVDGCVKILARRATGIYHISGREMTSVADFAFRVARIFHFDPGLITPVTTADLREPAPRPLKTGFVIDKAVRELDYQPLGLDEALQIIKRNAGL